MLKRAREINDLVAENDFEHTAVEVECEDEACRMRSTCGAATEWK
jgi:hypothetical protein